MPYRRLPPASSWTNTRGFPLTPGRNNNNMASQGLAYDGCNFFRQRLVLSTLSGKRVKIKNIRSRDDNPGLRGESRLRSACGVAVSSAANGLAVTQLGVCVIAGRRRWGSDGRVAQTRDKVHVTLLCKVVSLFCPSGALNQCFQSSASHYLSDLSLSECHQKFPH